jgi:hypothetical protein
MYQNFDRKSILKTIGTRNLFHSIFRSLPSTWHDQMVQPPFHIEQSLGCSFMFFFQKLFLEKMLHNHIQVLMKICANFGLANYTKKLASFIILKAFNG